mmetsp:Transcript_16682/g.54317  ORF Transcript_16682/g.54317 Transcript_16682/m.54317 type:complete len:118 (+) Transcript_16682:217-570(+)
MPNPRVLSELDPATVAAMGDHVKSPEDEAKLAAEMEADRKQRLQEQRETGKAMLAIALALILFGWLNGYVAWQFNYVARKAGLARFPLPEDVAAFLDASVASVRRAWRWHGNSQDEL